MGFEQTKNFSMIATGFRRGWGEKHRLKNTLKGDEMYEKGKYLGESETYTRIRIPSG